MSRESVSVFGASEAQEFHKTWRFRLRRPRHQHGIGFGFLFRFVLAWLSVLIFILVMVPIGYLLNWEMNGVALGFCGALMCLLILFGEHLRSRVYERVSVDDPSHFEIELHTGRRPSFSLKYGHSSPDLGGIAERRALLAVWLKRCFDVLVASGLLILLLPLLAVIAALIKFESRGSALFRQRRRGLRGEEFSIYKFRTMKVAEDGDTVPPASDVDWRVTAVGRFLRRSSLDELPQLMNVLKGDMSLVGPRPIAVSHPIDARLEHLQKVLRRYAELHELKPGMTGLAQVYGYRGEQMDGVDSLELARRRLEFDLYYLSKWSLWLDFKILLKTALVVNRGLS